MTPEITFYVLLAMQALHLLHHRLAKRHISFAEVAGAAILCLPLSVLPAWLTMGLHLSMSGIQIIGSVWIDRLSPDWKAANRAAREGIKAAQLQQVERIHSGPKGTW